MEELQAILKASYDKEFRHHQFLAALKGHKMDAPGQTDAKSKFEEVKARAEAKARGESAASAEFDFFGIDVIEE